MLNETEIETERPGWSERAITRFRRTADASDRGENAQAAGASGADAPCAYSSVAAHDRVAEEWPVALVFNGISHAVMMATPRDLEAFAVGFALTEGIVEHGHDIQDIELQMGDDSAAVHLSIVQQAFVGLKEKRRALAGRSGCGVCGIESIELLDLAPEVVKDRGLLRALAPDALQRAAHQLPSHQALMQATGGVHAAAWCDTQGTVRSVFEDVGRHNALDKLIGHLTMQRADLAAGFVFMSSRASYELVRKAARMDIAMLATISAPSSLAIRIAEKARIRLVSFCREQGYVEYASGHADADTAASHAPA
jgi:FdhD protein